MKKFGIEIDKNSLTEKELLALLSAASVCRKEKKFQEILSICKTRGIKGTKIYEAILQTYLFAGFPSALFSLKMVNNFYPKKISSTNLRHTTNFEFGSKTCKKIYGHKFDKLIDNIQSFSPELAEWLVIEGYGKVLSRKGLSLAERELSIVSILSVQKFESQLYSHINGAVRQKVSLETIKRVINNLELLGNSSYTKFGLKVLNSFIDDKNNLK